MPRQPILDHLQVDVPVAQMDALDRWALHQTAVLLDECTKAYDAYEFHRVYQLCNQFCSVTLSAVYHDILKDRLYTLGANHPLRRSSQTAIRQIFETLLKILAPVVTFTADEAWSYAKTGQEYSEESVHLQDWPVAPTDWVNSEISGDFATLLRVRAEVNESIEPLRAAGKLGKSLDAIVELLGAPGDATFGLLEKYRDFLPELFIVSQVQVRPFAELPVKSSTDEGLTFSTAVRPCLEHGLVRCPRCWRWVPKLSVTSHGEVCPRCAEALNS